MLLAFIFGKHSIFSVLKKSQNATISQFMRLDWPIFMNFGIIIDLASTNHK